MTNKNDRLIAPNATREVCFSPDSDRFHEKINPMAIHNAAINGNSGIKANTTFIINGIISVLNTVKLSLFYTLY